MLVKLSSPMAWLISFESAGPVVISSLLTLVLCLLPYAFSMEILNLIAHIRELASASEIICVTFFFCIIMFCCLCLIFCLFFLTKLLKI